MATANSGRNSRVLFTSRRHFMRLMASFAGTAAISGCGQNPSVPTPGNGTAKATRGLIIGPGQFVSDGGKRYVLSVVDLDAKRPKAKTTPLEFFGHGVSPHPLEPEKAALFQKHGKGACIVDLKQGKVLRPIETKEALEFYGHGAYSRDGKLLYSTETDKTDGDRGLIMIRDAKTLEMLGEFPTFGIAPHDCVLIDEGKTLVITNGGGVTGTEDLANVVYVDVEDRKLLHKFELPPRINAGHLALSAEGNLAVVSAPRDGLDPNTTPGGISFRKGDGDLKTMQTPTETIKKMLGETLSVCIHEPSGIVGATNPYGHLVSFWKLTTGELVKSVNLKHARGITLTLDNKFFVVSYDEAHLTTFATDTLERVSKDDLYPSYMSGSHIITYQLS